MRRERKDRRVGTVPAFIRNKGKSQAVRMVLGTERVTKGPTVSKVHYADRKRRRGLEDALSSVIFNKLCSIAERGMVLL